MATRRTEMTQESRRLLMEAAAGLFAERGYRQTSFADIADKAGISRGSIPWHFGNKLGLLEAVVDDQLQAVMAGFTLSAGQDLDESLDQVLAFIRMPATRLFITLLAEAAEVDSPIRDHYARLHATLRQGMAELIPESAVPAGTTPESVAILLVGAVIGVHAQWRIAPEAVDLDAVHITARTLVSALLATP
ncbi:TetR family transcriptional regulator [Nonomuraea sp. NPDC050536]|uniref:TetR family transcriptional regulator n=1 Tax=Nonomuraea sp. NPDC050536 TaxID=3364366 RepID=UPI0037CA64CD